jgi:acetyl esterase/lipase
MKRICLLSVALILMFTAAFAQNKEVINIFKEVPNQIKSDAYVEELTPQYASKVTLPQLFVFSPAAGKANGTAVIICPGGGYGRLAIDKEGYKVAEKFANEGITAFVLKYRLPSDLIMKDKAIGPLQDAQQAIKWVRENASKYGVNTNKIGIMGFSAGGHLASTASTHFNRVVIANKKETSVRPDFSILIYPVITFGEFTHPGSKNNLIGQAASEEQVKLYSNELQVTAETPITFLVHANDDKAVPAENSLDYVKALKKFNIKNELHLYQSGGHGFGLENKTSKDDWFKSLINWMSINQL